MRTLVIAAAAMLAVTAAVAAGRSPAAEPPAPQLPAKFTNLQVLSKDTNQAQLVDVMKSFTQGLDVRCEFCHVGEGNDLSKFDFASDTKPQKATARTMMKMTNAVATDYLAKVGTPSATPKVTCYTCHRGDKKPITAPPKTED